MKQWPQCTASRVANSSEFGNQKNAADAEDLDDEALEALQVDEHRIAILLNGNYVHTR